MIFKHIILFKFKPSISDQEIESLFIKIGGLKQKISGILSYSWGPNEWKGPSNDYDYCFVMDFDSKMSRDAYQINKEHVRVVEEHVLPIILQATVFDYFVL